MDLSKNSIFILIEGSKDLQTDDFEDIIKVLTEKDYYEHTKEERKAILKHYAAVNAVFRRLPVRDSYKKGDDVNNAIYSCDEKSFLLSLLNTSRQSFLFERIDSHIIAKNIQPRGYEKDYCVINTHAEELLKNHLNRQLEDRDR